MKKEILFRGKRLDNGEFVYGDLVINKPTQTYRIFCDFANVRHGNYTDSGLHECSGNLHNVIPETVGQFTGLTDKNGKKIFEGDILNYGFRTNDLVEFAIHKCSKPSHGGPDEYEYWGYETDSAYRGNYRDSVIIGNIFDNPELIKNY